eukprot:GILI01003979.1.p1 GENE.GILI01003979.1~~GILI01003979.1.p1  ORF type:complete len:546 (+),score=186.55 GILI01003979.1:133-1770(+)
MAGDSLETASHVSDGVTFGIFYLVGMVYWSKASNEANEAKHVSDGNKRHMLERSSVLNYLSAIIAFFSGFTSLVALVGIGFYQTPDGRHLNIMRYIDWAGTCPFLQLQLALLVKAPLVQTLKPMFNALMLNIWGLFAAYVDSSSTWKVIFFLISCYFFLSMFHDMNNNMLAGTDNKESFTKGTSIVRKLNLMSVFFWSIYPAFWIISSDGFKFAGWGDTDAPFNILGIVAKTSQDLIIAFSNIEESTLAHTHGSGDSASNGSIETGEGKGTEKGSQIAINVGDESLNQTLAALLRMESVNPKARTLSAQLLQALNEAAVTPSPAPDMMVRRGDSSASLHSLTGSVRQVVRKDTFRGMDSGTSMLNYQQDLDAQSNLGLPLNDFDEPLSSRSINGQSRVPRRSLTVEIPSLASGGNASGSVPELPQYQPTVQRIPNRNGSMPRSVGGLSPLPPATSTLGNSPLPPIASHDSATIEAKLQQQLNQVAALQQQLLEQQRQQILEQQRQLTARNDDANSEIGVGTGIGRRGPANANSAIWGGDTFDYSL